MRGRHRRRMSTRIELLDLRAQAITAATTRRARGSHGLSSRRNWVVMAAPTITAASLRAARLEAVRVFSVEALGRRVIRLARIRALTAPKHPHPPPARIEIVAPRASQRPPFARQRSRRQVGPNQTSAVGPIPVDKLKPPSPKWWWRMRPSASAMYGPASNGWRMPARRRSRCRRRRGIARPSPRAPA